MKPIKYVKNGENVLFKYLFTDLKELLLHCKTYNIGYTFITRIDGLEITYKNITCEDGVLSFGSDTVKMHLVLDAVIHNVMNPVPVFRTHDEFGVPVFECKMLKMSNNKK